MCTIQAYLSIRNIHKVTYCTASYIHINQINYCTKQITLFITLSVWTSNGQIINQTPQVIMSDTAQSLCSKFVLKN